MGVPYLPTVPYVYLPYDHGDTVQTTAPRLRAFGSIGIKLDWAPNIRMNLSARDMDSWTCGMRRAESRVDLAVLENLWGASCGTHAVLSNLGYGHNGESGMVGKSACASRLLT